MHASLSTRPGLSLRTCLRHIENGFAFLVSWGFIQSVAPITSSPPLRGRIPPEGAPRILRLKLTQTALATVVCMLALLVAAPREALGIGLVGLVPVSIGIAYWQWRRYWRSLEGPANPWLDAAGVHWLY